MSFLRPSLGKQTTQTSGTGALTLIANAGDTRSLQQCLGAGPVKARFMLRGNGYFEQFLGAFTAPSTLSRDSVISSSNSDNPVSIPAGTVTDVYLLDYAQFQIDRFTGNKTLANVDASNSWVFTGSANSNLSLGAISAAIPDYWGFFKNAGSAVLTLVANGSDTIEDGGTASGSIAIYPGQSGFLYLDPVGAIWRIARDAFGVASNPNKIINGDMAIDQRNAGASLAFTNASKYLVDRFGASSSGLTTQTLSGQQVASSLSGGGKSLKFTVGGTGAAPASGAINYFYQAIEGYNAADLLWGTASAKPLAISFPVKASVSGNYGLVVRNGAGNRSYVVSVALTANVESFVSAIIPGDTSGTWATDNTAGPIISWDLGTGTTGSAAAGSWQGTGYTGLTSGTKLVSTTGATLEIGKIKAETGSVVTPFQADDFAVSLTKCKRYFEKIEAITNFQFFGLGVVSNSTTQFFASIANISDKRVAPTVAYSANADFLINAPGGGFSITGISQANGYAKNCGLLNVTPSSALATGLAGTLEGANNTNAWITWSAEL